MHNSYTVQSTESVPAFQMHMSPPSSG